MAKNSNTKNNTVNNFKFDEAYDKNKWAEHLGENFTEKYGSISSEEEILEKNKDFLKSVIWIGDLNVCDNNDETIGVYEVRITNTRLASRVKISRLCSKILSAGEYGKGIFFILYEDKEGIYRVSYVKHDRIGVFVGNAIEIKKDYSNPKRYTFLLGEGIKVHTPQSRLTSDIFKSVASIENAFSVEGVNKEFYNGVKKYFEYIHNDVIKYFDKDENKAKEFALRFLGRVLFCWFLREKELIPNEILNSGVFENLKYKENYYSDVLEDLFFNVLNMDMEKRKFSKDRVIYNYEKSIPFLNGGLFSKKEDDEAVKTIDDNIIKELFEFFDMYNFTVDESAPFDVEISIDPEMLGRIFENLLAEINPETEKSAKDESGSFYTPREIVDYMVIDAIKLYLYKKLPDMKDKIDGIFDVEESIEYSDKERELILKNIHDMIILDPACGSGAFPLGILQRVFNVIDKLDPKHEYYKELTLKDVTDPIVKAKYEKYYSTKEFNYIYKLFILQNNIHGVDIQPIAVEISRLRAFLSLIIDEEKNEKEDNLGINPLPNLDFQFICANTLVPLKLNPTEKMFIEGHIKNLRKSMNNYFNVHDKEDKKVAENDVEAFFEQIERDESLESETKNIICSWHPFKNKPSLYFDYKLQFGLDRKFDIVIGNPPYTQIQGMANRLKEMYQNVGYETFKSTGDIYQLFYEKCLFLLSDDGVASLITSNKWMRAGYGASTREYFYKNADVFRIIDLGAGRFESATVDVNIILYSKTKEKNIRGERSFKGATYSGSLKDIRSAEFYDVVSDAGKEWVIMSGLERSIFNKINKHKALKYWNIDIKAGIKTGFNEAFIIDENTKNELIKKDKNSKFLIKPMLKGRNILKYKCNFNNLYIIATLPALNLNIDEYPAIKNYLKSFGKRLEQSGEKGCRKKTNNKWFETQDSIAYYNNFNKPKIMFNKASKVNAFYLDDESKYYGDVTTYILSSDNNLKYLLAILNSYMFYYAYNKYYAGGGIEGELTLFTLELFPIPEADSKTKNKIVKLVDKIIEFKKQGQDTSDLEMEVDEIVYSLYGLSEDEIRVIEG